MRKDITHSDGHREDLQTLRRPSIFAPWANDYWEPSRWFDNFLNSDLSVFPTDNRFLSPAIDIDETADEYLVSTDLPGIKSEDISIDCSGNQLTIAAERKHELSDGRKQGRRERFYGTYQRTFNLPVGADVNKIEATFEEGVLTVHVPKGDNIKSKRIPINELKTSASDSSEIKH